jgi:hypothetical protein
MYRRILILIVLTVLNLIAVAQKKSYTAARIKDKAPEIDGQFDDNAWSIVDWQDDFTQNQPKNGEKPSQKTCFKILYDEDNIYVAIKAYDSDPTKIAKRLTRRDGWDGDRVGIQFDSYHDQRTAFVFFVNAAGVKNDRIMTNDGDNTDDNWDPIWYTKTSMDSDGWNAEMKIPLSQLRFSSKDEQVWGLQVNRFIFRDSENDLWQHIPSNASGWISNYGELNGLKGLKPKRQVEIAPFLVGKYDNYEKEQGNPYSTGSDFSFNAGVDGKIGLTNNLILDFSINPDFGQVEADPSELNLTAFESYFSEKRPFFIEGSNITYYQLTPGGHPWASDNLFYSRRIGRTPQYSPDLGDNEYAKIPESTNILGAFKLTGKSKDGWSLGIVESIGNKEKADIYSEGLTKQVVVEPFTNYLIGRLQKDINKGNTIVGTMFTSTNRSLDNTGLETILTKNAITGGIDFQQYFFKKKYYISTKFVASKINGTKEAILDQQKSSRRYYQRPDENYYRLDSSLTSLSGTGGTFLFGKQANSGLRFLFNATWRSPGLELNDVGYLRQANTVFQFFWVGYSITKPFSIFRGIYFNANQWAAWDFSKVNLFNGANFSFDLEFKNQWSFGSGFSLDFESISNTDLWGGPSIKLPGDVNYFAYLSSNQTKKFNVETSFYQTIGNEGYFINKGIDASFKYRPINNLSISLSPGYSIFNTKLQIIDNFTYNNSDRYIFGSMDQKTLSLTARIDFNITPDLTIQYYGSPYITVGEYSEIKRITNPKADKFSDRFYIFGNELSYSSANETYYIDESGDGISDYSFDNPNFNFKQFRSNFVIRWEYTPGSLIYMVWSQGVTEDTFSRFNYFNNLGTLFSKKGHNTFLIKLSYRIRGEKLKRKSAA